MCNLNVNKSPGPDGIPNIVLKCANSVLTPYLTKLFKISVQGGQVPKDWKHATVVPIYKNGNLNKRENYRPVSLTSTVCKVLEKLVLNRLWYFISDRCPLNDSQFGFRTSRSCSSQLISYVDLLTKALDKGLCADVVYLDLSKAFDKVSHVKLIQKLNDRKIPTLLNQRIKAF